MVNQMLMRLGGRAGETGQALAAFHAKVRDYARELPRMADATKPNRRALALGLAAASAGLAAPEARAQADDTFSEDEVKAAADAFFGKSAEGLASVVRYVFQKQGEPTGYIEGQEGSGAFVFGLRIGRGRLYFRGLQNNYRIYWTGPSVGVDTGGNGSKVFMLVYGATDASQIYNARIPGVEGSAYLVGGVGVNFMQLDNIILAPMRAGVGWRLGASIGYLHFSASKNIFPF
jgi:hypothetical protein